MLGRPPKPNATKRLQGSRHYNPNEPKAPQGIPACPKYIKGAARRIWTATATLLQQMQLLTLADVGILARYSVVYARWLEAEKHVSEEGPLSQTANGYNQKGAWLTVSDKCIAQLDKMDSKLGLSPSDRSRLNAKVQESNDALDSFLNKDWGAK